MLRHTHGIEVSHAQYFLIILKTNYNNIWQQSYATIFIGLFINYVTQLGEGGVRPSGYKGIRVRPQRHCRGEGGVCKSPKLHYIVFEWSLMQKKFFKIFTRFQQQVALTGNCFLTVQCCLETSKTAEMSKTVEEHLVCIRSSRRLQLLRQPEK